MEKRNTFSTSIAARMTRTPERTIRRYAREGRISARQKGNSYWEVTLVFRAYGWDFEWNREKTRPSRPNALA